MRGTWNDVNRRLTGALLALDLNDALVIGDRRAMVKSGFLGLGPRRPDPGPRRFVQITAARTSLIAECVGSTSFGGTWAMSEDTESALQRLGWEKPWSPDYPTFQREAPLVGAPRLALATVRALEVLGCEVADLEVELVHEEPDD